MQLSFSDKIKPLKGKYQKCVLEKLHLMVGSLITSKTVNLYKQKDHVQSLLGSQETKPSSHYAQLIRFMKDYSYTDLWLDCLDGALSLLDIKSDTYYLDATEWQCGDLKIHLLVLCVNWQGVAVPVYFRPYWHKGVLSQEARIRFIRRAMKVVDLKGKIIVADREFIGADWFLFLSQSGIRFVMRLREGMYKKDLLDGKEYHKLKVCALKKGYAKGFIKISGFMYRIEFWKNSNPDNVEEQVIYLLTNVLDKKKIGKKYATRWRIEYCFKHLKTNGFDLEDMSWDELGKIRLCMSLVIVAYATAVREGKLEVEKAKKEGLKTEKKYKDGSVYLAVSMFRNGLAYLVFFASDLVRFTKYLNKIKLQKNSFYQIV